MTREPDYKRVEKRTAMVFWRRAVQCEAAMKEALARGHWKAAGINAVHCAISANDAVLAAIPAIKVTSKDHLDAVRLLSSRLKSEDAQGEQKVRLTRHRSVQNDLVCSSFADFDIRERTWPR